MLLAAVPDLKVRIAPASAGAARQAAGRAAREALERSLRSGFDLTGCEEDAAEAAELLSYVPPDAGLSAQKRKYSVSQIAMHQDGAGRTGGGPARLLCLQDEEEEKLSPAERGTAYHTVMEHIPFSADGKSPGEVRAFIDGLASRGIMTAAEASSVDEAQICAFFSSPLGKRILASPDVRKETPFTIKTEYEGRSVMVQGTIDCFFAEDDGLVLVDYKTNYVNEAEKQEAYERLRRTYMPQLALYRQALEKCTGRAVKEALLYLFGTGESLELE
jgi:ATP-dependent exoDNAse (exonuclease V) beta subunit